jgi:TonB family protein
MLASPTTAPRTTLDTAAATTASIGASKSAAPAAQPTGTADARRADVRVPDVKSIRLPDAMGVVQSSMSRRMDSSLHALTGNALMLGTGEPGSRRSDGSSASASPADYKPPALAVGSPMPEYPPSLRSEGVTGGVLAEFVVGSDGHADVSTLEVLHSDNRLFTAAVRKALPNMQFVPAESSGHRISQRLQMPFRFTPGTR